MPLISLAMLVGLMAMAALPPLNGFAGEWVIYQSFFKMSTGDLFIGRLLGPLLAVGLAITGALAVMCMAKVYGVTFLGAPRTKEAEYATCAPRLMTLSVVLAAVFCLVGGIAAPWLLPLVSGAFPVQAQVSSVVSQPMIALLLIACPLLPFLLMIFFKGDRLGGALARRGVGLRLRPRAVDGGNGPRLCHAGERGLCAVAEAASLAEPGASGAGLAIGLGAGAAARDRAG